MPSYPSPSRYLRNPLTGECRAVSAHEGRRLASYEWTYITLTQFKAWQVAKFWSLPRRAEASTIHH